MLLENTLSGKTKKESLVLLEHDLTRSAIPLIRDLIQRETVSKKTLKKHQSSTILITFLYPPNVFVKPHQVNGSPKHIVEKDYSSRKMIGARDKLDTNGILKDILDTIEAVSHSDAITLIVDSVDTMALDVGSSSSVLRLLQEVAETIKGRKASSRLILSITSSSSLLPQLTPPSFSQALTHIRLYHPFVLLHMHRSFLLPPPPVSNTTKFYSVFYPFVQRERRETEFLIFGISQETNTSYAASSEIVIETMVRSAGLRKGTENKLEGWKEGTGPCRLDQLDSLASCFVAKAPLAAMAQKPSTDPTQNLSFNLNLTTEQQESRAQVPLPYAHTGETSISLAGSQAPATIYYDPDSADDFDDEDPDEDLDL